MSAPVALASVDQAALAAAPHAPRAKDLEAARQFEGMVMGQLFQAMRKTVEPSGLFGDAGQARSTYEYLLDQAVVDAATKAGRGFGLADRLASQWRSLEKPSAVNGLQESDHRA